MHKSRGKFIVLEGMEGCGKSTLAANLRRYFESSGKKVYLSREPGGTQLGNLIRNTLLHQTQLEISPLAQVFLLQAARAEHVNSILKPQLDLNDYVICDRFTLSTLAYQGHAFGLGMNFVHQLNQSAIGTCKPDLTLYLDIAIDTSLQRLARRYKGETMVSDRFENEGLDFHRKVAAGYREAITIESNCKVIDANKDIDSVLNLAITEIASL